MKLKRKLISCICMFAVALTSLVVGVWALKTVDFTVGGNLSYVAPGIEATISKGTLANGTFVNSADASTKMPQTQITKTDTTSTLATKFAKWQNLSLAFNEAGDDTTITFSITNDMSSKYLVIDISTTYNSADNATISINTSSAVLEPSASQSFTITLAVTDKTADASLSGFSVVFNMTMSDTNPVVDLQYDSTNDYYYVEMGTYNSSAVRWKLVGVDGAPLGSADAPDAGMGTFILETLIDYNALNKAFDSSDNDYATSDIRTYLNGEYKTFLNLTDDATYNAITAREISDLYTDMAWRTDDKYQVEDISLPSGATGADKLWLMSVAEVYTLLGGGTIGADGTIASSWSTEVKAGCNWDADNTSDYYWLRSPYPVNSYRAFRVYGGGDCYDTDVDWPLAVRPAFNVRFKYKKPGKLEYDSENDYYYVEMGTYQSNPVKWRLVGVKESGASETTKFTGSTAPSAGSVGTFILETNTGITQSFNASEGNNYATSDIRTYLNGDYITALNLANDATYNAITAREITDLHTDIGWASSSDGTTVPNEGGDDAYAPPTGTKPNATYNTSVEGATGADKLWLMSVKEIYTLVGGGALGANGTIPYDWSAYYDNLIWRRNSTDEYGVYYWLRSPYPGNSSYAFSVRNNGAWGGHGVARTRAVRPAFNLEF